MEFRRVLCRSSERQRAEIGGPVELALALDILADDAAAHLRKAVEIIRIFGTRDPRAFLEFLPFECPLSHERPARRPLEPSEIRAQDRWHMRRSKFLEIGFRLELVGRCPGMGLLPFELAGSTQIGRAASRASVFQYRE